MLTSSPHFFSSPPLFLSQILFLLGPETSGTISYHLSCFLHALADILCKNLFALFAWHFRQVKLPEMERRYAAAEDNKGVTMVGQLESGYSVVPSPAGAPLKFEMSQSSLAGAHPQQQMPDGTSALVLRMREKLRRKGKTLRDLTRPEFEDLANESLE